MTRDPVCGMQVDESKTTATSVYGGKTYYFCSNACQQTFEKAPETYAKPGGEGDLPPTCRDWCAHFDAVGEAPEPWCGPRARIDHAFALSQPYGCKGACDVVPEPSPTDAATRRAGLQSVVELASGS